MGILLYAYASNMTLLEAQYFGDGQVGQDEFGIGSNKEAIDRFVECMLAERVQIADLMYITSLGVFLQPTVLAPAACVSVHGPLHSLGVDGARIAVIKQTKLGLTGPFV